MSERARTLPEQTLRFLDSGEETSLKVSELGVDLVVDDSAARALSVGRGGSVLSNMARYARGLVAGEDLSAVVRVDHARFRGALDTLAKRLIHDPPVPGAILIVPLS